MKREPLPVYVAEREPLPVYVAAPYDRAYDVRTVHEQLRARGAKPTSQWATLAKGIEQLDVMSRSEIASAIEVNDHCLRQARILLVLASQGTGGEMFAEVARALSWGMGVLWVGRRILSAYRPNVYLCEHRGAAFAAIEYAAAHDGAAVDSGRARHLLAEFFRAQPAEASGA